MGSLAPKTKRNFPYTLETAHNAMSAKLNVQRENIQESRVPC